MAQTVEATGSLRAQPFASLTWETEGVVQDVYVEAGDQVKAGDVLMKLNTNSVPSSILSAQADLSTAQKELDDLLISSEEELAQAVIDLKDAHEMYDEAVNYLKYLQRRSQGVTKDKKAFPLCYSVHFVMKTICLRTQKYMKRMSRYGREIVKRLCDLV